MKKLFSIILAISGLCMTYSLRAQVSVSTYEKIPSRVNHLMLPADRILFQNRLGEQIQKCIENRIKAQDVAELVDIFKYRDETWCWKSEFWGKWMLSAVKAYEYCGDKALFQKMRQSVADLISTQTEDGYIGNYPDSLHLESWDIWGRKYVLLGLIYYYDITGDKKSLNSAKKLADHLIAEAGPGKVNIVRKGYYRGMAATSVLEPVVLLYQRTAYKPYLDFAKYIIKQWETPDGPRLISKALNDVDVANRFTGFTEWWSWENGQKAYEMMSCYDGLLQLYKVTGQPEYLEAVQKVFNNILRNEINIAGSGASKECWFYGKKNQIYPAYHTMETCVTTTWIKLCYELFRITGDPAIIDEIERSAYNNLLGSMHPDGHTFCKYSGLEGFRSEDDNQCGMSLNCCIANGPRGLVLLPDAAITTRDDEIFINMYNPANGEVKFSTNHTVRITIDGTYPAGGKVNIHFYPEDPSVITTHFRIPAWSYSTSITTGVEKRLVPEPGSYYSITKNCMKGDSVILDFDMRGQVHSMENSVNTFHAITRGPITLARDSRFDSDNLMGVAKPLRVKNDIIELKSMELEDTWMAFSTQFAIGYAEKTYTIDIPLIDFSSAGNTWDKSNYYRVWIPSLTDPKGR